MLNSTLHFHLFTPMQPKASPALELGSSPQPIDEMLERMYEHIGWLKARAARAPPTPSGSSVTEPDSDLDKDESGTVSFLRTYTAYSNSLQIVTALA
jgi:hypothetical protein